MDTKAGRQSAGRPGGVIQHIDVAAVKLFQIDFGKGAEHAALALDVADVHDLVRIQRDGPVAVAVQLFAQDAGAEGVAVQPHHQVEQGGPVAGLDHLPVVIGAVHLLGQIERLALIEGKAGVGGQVLQRDERPLGQRMTCRQKDIGAAGKQFGEFQAAVRQQLFQYLPVEVVQIEHTHLAFAAAHVFQNFGGAAFVNAEGVLIRPELTGQLNEGLDREGIVLGGDAELLFHLPLEDESLFGEAVLADDLPGIGEKLFPLGGGDYAPVGAAEQREAQLLFQAVNAGGQTGLRQVQPLGGPVHGGFVRHGDNVDKLLQSHGVSLLFETYLPGGSAASGQNLRRRGGQGCLGGLPAQGDLINFGGAAPKVQLAVVLHGGPAPLHQFGENAGGAAGGDAEVKGQLFGREGVAALLVEHREDLAQIQGRNPHLLAEAGELGIGRVGVLDAPHRGERADDAIVLGDDEGRAALGEQGLLFGPLGVAVGVDHVVGAAPAGADGKIYPGLQKGGDRAGGVLAGKLLQHRDVGGQLIVLAALIDEKRHTELLVAGLQPGAQGGPLDLAQGLRGGDERQTGGGIVHSRGVDLGDQAVKGLDHGFR